MNPTNGTPEDRDLPFGPVQPAVNPAVAQAQAAEVIAQFVRWMIEDGHPPEPDSPLWRFVKRAA